MLGRNRKANPLDTPKDVLLVGNFHCSLTTQQQNEWVLYRLNHPTYQRMVAVEIEIAVCTARVQGGFESASTDMKRLWQEHETIGRDMFRVASEWYRENVDPDSPNYQELEKEDLQTLVKGGREIPQEVLST